MRNGGGRAATADGGAADWDVKFAVPLATHLVSRPRLHARLTAGLQSCCTLIAAPAGWGKTLLAGSWLAEGGAADRAAAWVSLGPSEDDVRALWTAIATAIIPVIGERAAADLRHVVTDDDLETVPGQIAAVLADDATPVVLVLDNLHEITSLAVHESLLRLVQRPPLGLRFVATTRRDPPWPLDRLRLAGVITEIRAAELAFRVDETAGVVGPARDRPRRRRTSVASSSGPRGGRPVSGWPPCSCRAAQIPPGSSTRSPATTTRWPPTC